jgi:hypothetical protein
LLRRRIVRAEPMIALILVGLLIGVPIALMAESNSGRR